MLRILAGTLFVALVAVSCGGSDTGELVSDAGSASATCLATDPDCDDDGLVAAGPLPSAIALGSPDDPNAPALISFGGFFYSDGQTTQLCSALAESFPPQCGSVVIDIEADLETALDHVRESFGNPDDAKINNEDGIYWTDDWVQLAGSLQANRLVLD